MKQLMLLLAAMLLVSCATAGIDQKERSEHYKDGVFQNVNPVQPAFSLIRANAFRVCHRFGAASTEEYEGVQSFLLLFCASAMATASSFNSTVLDWPALV